MLLPRALITAAALVGCACGAPAARAPASSTPRATAPAPDYEVHEWGLVRGDTGDVLQIGAIAPPVVEMPMVVLKPVLYFHASAPFTLASVGVAASPGGQIVEAWPLVALGDHIEWTSVAIDPGGACTPSALPTITDPPCTALGGGSFCEVAGLAVARTEASCVRVGETTERFLFYRGRSTTLTPPLTYEHVGDHGEIRVTSDGDAAIPGTLVRIGSQMGVSRALAISPPAPHASITVPPPPDDATTEPGRAALRASMSQLGLTSDEADAFLRAWDASLFGSEAPGAQLDLALAPPMPTDTFLYFLPEASTEDVARLTFEPPPRAVHRAIAVWSSVPMTGSSR